MDLAALCDVLDADGLTAVFEPESAEFDADRVDVALEIEGFADPLTLQITQVETNPDTLPDLEMAQLYAPIPIEFDEDSVQAILEVLPDVNEAVPLIGFNLHLEESFVYFRHVMLVPVGEMGQRLITEAAWMVNFALDTYAQRFAAIARPKPN